MRGKSLLAVIVFAIVSVPALSAPGFSSEPAKYDLEIERQPLGRALQEFAKQSGVQIIFFSKVTEGHEAPALKGKFTATDALERLLNDSRLTFRALNPNTIEIRPKEAVNNLVEIPGDVLAMNATEGPNPGTAKRGGWFDRFRLAQADETASTKYTDKKSDEEEEGTVRRDDAGIPVELGEVLVTGTHIRARAPVGAQLITIDRAEIERTGFGTVQEVVRALPQNFGGGVSEDTTQGLEANTNAARSVAPNLRGLGAGATLVLLNGRRLAPGGTEGIFSDVWSIPITAIERIDVLPDGASAIYGSDAVGGVVNFILRTDYKGAETQARLGSVTDGGLEEYQFGQALGTHWGSGHGLLSYEYYKRSSLPASERELAADSDLRRFGGSNFNGLSDNPGTIVIGGQTWAIPRGQDGRSLTAGDLVAGTANLANRNEGRDLLAEHQRHSAFGTVTQEVAGRIKLFAEGLFSKRDAQANNPGLPRNLSVPSTNPFYVNPTGGTGPITVRYNFIDDLGPRELDLDIETYNAAIGATVDAAKDWRVMTYGGYALEEVTQVQGSVNGAALNAALADPDPARAFNPFGDGSFTNPATLATLRANTLFTTDSKLWVGNVTADGPILPLSGADVRLAIGTEYRQQSFDSINRVPGPFEFRASFDREVTSAFAEILVPFVGEDRARPGLQRLELSLAGRYEDYSDFGSAMTPKAGVAWSPVAGLTVRGAWSESFKAPNLADLDELNNFSIIFPVSDPLSSTGTSPVLLWTGKNADLQEETATSRTLGVDFAPRWIPGLQIGLSYFDVEYEDRIQEAPFTATWLQEPRFAGIVTRDPTSAQRDVVCRRSTFVGGEPVDCRNAPIAAIVDLRANNTAVTEITGLDLIAAYDFGSRLGRFSTALNASHVFDFAIAQEGSSPLVELVSTATNPVDLRLRGSVSWRQQSFGATAFVNYTDSYTDTVSEPDRKVGSWTTIDLQLRYDTGEGRQRLLDKTVLSLNVQNLFDEVPPFFNNPTGVGYDQENADLMGRLVSLQLRKAW